MASPQIANAPCSWGTLEFAGMSGERITYTQMLDELVATGYVGTELGDWGFMPTDPHQLADELARRKANWKAPPLKHTRGTLYKFIKNVKNASEGCVTDE